MTEFKLYCRCCKTEFVTELPQADLNHIARELAAGRERLPIEGWCRTTEECDHAYYQSVNHAGVLALESKVDHDWRAKQRETALNSVGWPPGAMLEGAR